ncbi:tRNA wybutosine-synthesizing protein 2 homolog [Lycorma delicatula]|uniref:tRNA wybutosine-synthesizing protein 2 homolog n=1 Tax=Lycorma delicatula TaxID=130591 RepID=UPI003F518050
MKYQNPKQVLLSRLTEVMNSLNLWKDELKNEIPSSWERYNNFVIFNEKYFRSEKWYIAGSKVWIEVCKIFAVENIALKGRIQCDGYRTPNTKVVWGNSKWVKYTDNGIHYTWLIEHNMFCAGNASERHRVAKLNCEGETVVDLFAGIGYFTIPFLVYTKCSHVYACEWNPNAVAALKLNLKKNNVAIKCTVFEGDNRDVCPMNVADRVIMGLIPTSRKSWDVACRALKLCGGMLHLHENVTSKFRIELKESNMSEICQICENCLICLEMNSFSVALPVSISFGTTVMSLDNTVCSVYKGPQISLWKKYEWLCWAVHTVHTISEILLKQHDTPWKVTTKGLNYVKSYAPHIDHLVLDLECRPVTNN